jgi:hypothetical protein
LRRPEWTGHETVAAANTCLFAYENNTILTLIDCVNRANGNARSVSAMHACYRDRFLARFTLMDCYNFTPIDTYRDMVAFLTGNDTSTTVNTALNIT